MQAENNPHLVRNIIIILAIAVILISSGYQVITKILLGKKKGPGAVYSVGTMSIKKENIDMELSLQGTVEGDPQVRIYPAAGGKFIKNAVKEGDIVSHDETICYIDRDLVGENYLPVPVYSPITGMVMRLYFIDKGSPVTTNSPIADVANPDKIKVVLSVGEEDLVKISNNQKARIYSIMDSSRSLNGFVESVTPFVESDTQTGKAVVKAVNPDILLKIGMSVKVVITIGSKTAFMVPNEAVVMGMSRATVFLADKDKAKLVEVKTGYTSNGKTEIISDKLKDGDVIVTVGSFKLYDGAGIKSIKGKDK